MVEPKCLKNKNIEKCHTRKCFVYNRYNKLGLPCPYYIPSNKERGFLEDLNKISGIRIRRLYFNVWIYICLVILSMMIVIAALLEKSVLLFFQFAFESTQYMLVIIAIFIILSLLNICLFGRLICVVNEKGLYCNQKFLEWTQIKKATYDIDLPGRISWGYCSVKIEYDRGHTLIIPHAPRSILKQIIKHCQDVKVGLSTGSKFWIGIFVGMATFLPIIIVLIEGR